MLTLLRIFLFVSIAIAFSCANRSNQGFFRLVITIDTGANFYIDKITVLSGAKQSEALLFPVDSSAHSYYYFNSVPRGKAIFTVHSLFGRKYIQAVTLYSDKVIYIKRNQLADFDTDQAGEILNHPLTLADTIRLAMKSYGCPGGTTEKTEIIRAPKAFYVSHLVKVATLEEPILIQRQFDPGFSEALDTFNSNGREENKVFRVDQRSCEYFTSTSEIVFFQQAIAAVRMSIGRCITILQSSFTW